MARVVAPIADPNPLVAGAGLSPDCARPASKSRSPPEFAAEAEKLNEPFLHFMRTGRPLVTLKTAITLDGKISAPDDNRGWITSERARAHVQEVRHDHDAILTGIGTVLADDCLLTDRTGLPRCRPLLRIVLDSLLRLPLDSKMVRSACGDVLVVTTSRRLRRAAQAAANRAASRCWSFDGPGGRADLRSIVEWLGRQRYLSLMIEAGSKLNWTRARKRRGGSHLLLLRPQDSGRHGSAAAGRRHRPPPPRDAIRIHNITIHPIPPDEFAVEGYLDVHRNY